MEKVDRESDRPGLAQFVKSVESVRTFSSPFARDPHLQLLKLLQRGDARGLGSILSSRSVDFGALAKLLVHERLGVYVYGEMTEQSLQTLAPQELLGPLQKQHAAQQRRNREILEAITLIDAAFRQAGIDLVLLKGLCVAERFLRGTDRRFTWDIDLLVRKRDLAAALTALDQVGFVKPKRWPGLDRIAPCMTHAMECTRLDLPVDVHWTFRRRPGIRFDMESIWEQLETCRVGGIECRTPGKEHALVLMLAGLATDVERSHCRLRSLWDIYLMLAGMPETDWRGFLLRRETEGLRALTVNALALVLHGLDCCAEFPRLSGAIDENGALLAVRNGREAMSILERPRQSLANRAWFAALLPGPVWAYWLWWLGTVPVRFALGRTL